MSKVLRTPDNQFESLSGYNFTPNYVDIQDVDLGVMRVHYVDEGPADALPVIMMHGEPSWSYLYRGMISRVAASRLRY